ncbi:hypothetical protein IU474_05600 [Nocardia otitidiscaviarum]|uniref:GerW family sporulation protein n=1 Tax=Nocardia otitidiscaviarum TaxID=1823 RepID=UPI0018951C48|nr:hypothetical protein [Nocardia otitidiscaviarum]MBF6236553.1 hypothetical protein [Nocardia otitidiscaviarum]
MSVRDRLAEWPTADGGEAFGTPYQTPDGTTIVPVSRTGYFRKALRPVGMYVIREGTVRFEPAFDHTRIALLAELVGLVAAGLVTGAILRRPPWPDLRITQRVTRAG